MNIHGGQLLPAHYTIRIEHTRVTRDLDPYGLVVNARRWYLVGHDHLREAIRMFRLDKITEAAELHAGSPRQTDSTRSRTRWRSAHGNTAPKSGSTPTGVPPRPGS
jgi:predicted DNA-binding transcriptional regulator YafY